MKLTSLDERANILSRSATRSEKEGRDPGKCCQHSNITLYLERQKQNIRDTLSDTVLIFVHLVNKQTKLLKIRRRSEEKVRHLQTIAWGFT